MDTKFLHKLEQITWNPDVLQEKTTRQILISSLDATTIQRKRVINMLPYLPLNHIKSCSLGKDQIKFCQFLILQQVQLRKINTCPILYQQHFNI